MVYLNKNQRVALFHVWNRAGHGGLTYRQFRATVQPGPGCVLVRWFGMWLGIEPDGYTHYLNARRRTESDFLKGALLDAVV